MNAQSDAIQWLLEDDDPSVKFRTLTELLDYDDTYELRGLKSAILGSPPVQSLLESMHPAGYWLQRNPRTQRVVGDGVEYGSWATTHFCLACLSELGLDRTQPEVERAAGRYLALQGPDGDWAWDRYRHLSCLLGYNIRTFVRLGFRDDPHLTRSVELLLKTVREDGGYLCDIHEGNYKTRAVKSCIRGSVKALLAFSEFPDYWDHPRCKELVGYFLSRGGIFQSKHPGIPVNDDMDRLSFPITWRANTWEVLYALSRMGHGTDESLSAAWIALQNRAGPGNRFPLDWTPTECPWKVGEPGKPNKWITFYVELARRHQGLPLVA